MKPSLPILYTKPGCPWCSEARDVLVRRGVSFVEKNVQADADAFAEMRRISGQTKAPVLNCAGDILADFGAAELVPFLDARPTVCDEALRDCSN